MANNGKAAIISGDIIAADGSLDKKAFSALIFTDEDALKRANAIIHPAVKEEILRQMDEKKAQGCSLFVVEAALLIEEGYDKILDELWYVYADESVRFKRLEENRGYTREKSLSIMRRQKSDIEFRKYCRRIIDNSADLWETKAQIDAVRGIRSDRVLESLMRRELIEERGRSSGIGRPYLYGTTRRFLELFGFETLDDLPLIEDIDSLTLDDEDFEEPMPDQLTIPVGDTI